MDDINNNNTDSDDIYALSLDTSDAEVVERFDNGSYIKVIDGQRIRYTKNGKRFGRPKGRYTRPSMIEPNLTPLQYMQRVFQHPKTKPERADRMAVSAAPYVHARLQSIQSVNVNLVGDSREMVEQRLLEAGFDPQQVWDDAESLDAIDIQAIEDKSAEGM